MRTRVRSLGSGGLSLLLFHTTLLYNKTNIQHIDACPSKIFPHLLIFILLCHCTESVISHHHHSCSATDIMTIYSIYTLAIWPQPPQDRIRLSSVFASWSPRRLPTMCILFHADHARWVHVVQAEYASKLPLMRRDAIFSLFSFLQLPHSKGWQPLMPT